MNFSFKFNFIFNYIYVIKITINNLMKWKLILLFVTIIAVSSAKLRRDVKDAGKNINNNFL
jgi:hypothetical protein